MTIDFAAEPSTPPPGEGGPWVWTGTEWVEVITDTGDGIDPALDLDTDNPA